MGYFLPLKFFKVSPDCAICATRVIAIMDTTAYQARETIKQERRAKTLINAAGRDRAKSAIFMDNGSVVAAPRSTNTLLNAINKAGSKRAKPTAHPGNKIKVYEAELEEDDVTEDDELYAEEEDEDVSDESDDDFVDDESDPADEDD